ncbi:MAG: methyltransferase domain-containing protein [Chloroflexi bacterium]|nr:methyltransferase domain-containing protein [Chloroflexota bacterium]MBU1747784.1 methyltransferase domain-containing protein [Chloroflexota bacterium]MBU1879812.1 methyltransferase domain-containing protein [Chloroflexota bacterium]
MLQESRSRQPERASAIPFAIWEKGGTTEHLGGIYATERLLAMCHLGPGQTVLVLGCGTGYTACHLAQHVQAHVVAVDISPRSVAEARKRVAGAGLGERVVVIQGDAHRLAAPDCAYDTLIAESVLAFCNADTVATEAWRVLRPGSVLGINELTLLKPPPAELLALLRGTLGLWPFQEQEWRAILTDAGFVDVVTDVRPVSLREQFVSHIRVDGVRKYLSAVVGGVSDAGIRRAFFTRDMLRAARQFRPYVGYGLYAGQKAR